MFHQPKNVSTSSCDRDLFLSYPIHPYPPIVFLNVMTKTAAPRTPKPSCSLCQARLAETEDSKLTESTDLSVRRSSSTLEFQLGMARWRVSMNLAGRLRLWGTERWEERNYGVCKSHTVGETHAKTPGRKLYWGGGLRNGCVPWSTSVHMLLDPMTSF